MIKLETPYWKDAMDNQELVAEWQKRIFACCEGELGRELSSNELQSIKQFRGFQALEAIEDTVSNAQPDQVEPYLNSIVAQ